MAPPNKIKSKWQWRNSVVALLLCIDLGAFTWYLWWALPDKGSFDHTTKVITTVAGWVVSLLAFFGVKSATRKQSFAAFLNLPPVELCTLAITAAVWLFVLPIHGVTISVVAAGTRRPLPDAAVTLDTKRFLAGTDGTARAKSLLATSHHLKVEHNGYDAQEATVAFEDVLWNHNISVALNANRGTIIATSDPAEAAVYLDDDTKTVKGYTPFTLEIEAGRHRIHLAKAGFQPTEWQEIKIEGGQQTEVKKTLQRLAGPAKQYQVRFFSVPSGAIVEVDGKSWGKTPQQVPLTLGRHTVRYRIGNTDCAKSEPIQVPPFAHLGDCGKQP